VTSDSHAPVFFHDFAGPEEICREIEAAGFRAHERSPSVVDFLPAQCRRALGRYQE
jgi:hypothetical protein